MYWCSNVYSQPPSSLPPCLLYDAHPTSQTAAMNVKKLKMSSQVSRGILREKLPETTPELARKSEGTDSKVPLVYLARPSPPPGASTTDDEALGGGEDLAS